MTCHCGCNKTYTDTRADGTVFEVVFSKDACHCRGCGTLVLRSDTRAGFCIDCLAKRAKARRQNTLFDGIGG